MFMVESLLDVHAILFLLDLQFYTFVYAVEWNKVNRIECNFVQIRNILIGIICTILLYVHFHGIVKPGNTRTHTQKIAPFFSAEQ